MEKSGTGVDVDEVIVGNVLAAGAGMGPGRQAAVGGGVPAEVPAYSVNMLCCSGMKASINAMAEIGAGNEGIVIAAVLKVPMW